MRSASASVMIAAAFATACGGSSGDGARQAPSATASTEESTAPGTGSTTTAPPARVVSLLADRRLLTTSVATGAVVTSMRLGPRSPTPDVGRFLALSRDGDTLFALVPWTPKTRQVVAVIDPETLRRRTRLRLPRGVAFRSLVVGSRSGWLYVVGNQPARRRTPAPQGAVVAVLNPRSGAVRSIWNARSADDRFWWVLDAAVSQDERRLYFSYHGGCDPETEQLCTSGADRLDITRDGARRCRRQPHPATGCLARVHGGVEAYAGGLIATTGGVRIVQIDRRGRVARTWRSGIPRNHLMQFALDRRRDRLYAIGSCAYSGGLSRIDLETGRARVTGYPSSNSPDGVCGERIAVGPRSLLAVARNPGPVPQGSRSRLLLLDGNTGRVMHSVAVPVETIDLVVAP